MGGSNSEHQTRLISYIKTNTYTITERNGSTQWCSFSWFPFVCTSMLSDLAMKTCSSLNNYSIWLSTYQLMFFSYLLVPLRCMLLIIVILQIHEDAGAVVIIIFHHTPPINMVDDNDPWLPWHFDYIKSHIGFTFLKLKHKQSITSWCIWQRQVMSLYWIFPGTHHHLVHFQGSPHCTQKGASIKRDNRQMSVSSQGLHLYFPCSDAASQLHCVVVPFHNKCI